MHETFRQRHLEIVARVEDKLKQYFKEQKGIPRVRKLPQHVEVKSIKKVKDLRISSARVISKNNEEEISSLIKIAEGKRRKQSQVEGQNKSLLDELDCLKQRLGKLQKSSSCTNLLNKADKKTHNKVSSSTKLITEQSKCTLKKKGKLINRPK